MAGSLELHQGLGFVKDGLAVKPCIQHLEMATKKLLSHGGAFPCLETLQPLFSLLAGYRCAAERASRRAGGQRPFLERLI